MFRDRSSNCELTCHQMILVFALKESGSLQSGKEELGMEKKGRHLEDQCGKCLRKTEDEQRV